MTLSEVDNKKENERLSLDTVVFYEKLYFENSAMLSLCFFLYSLVKLVSVP